MIILLLIMITGLVSDAVAGEENIVNVNGTFENSDVTVSGDTTSVEGWEFFVQDGAEGRYAIIDSVTKVGNRALAVSVEAVGPDDWSLGAVNEDVLVEPGENYTLALWARASEDGATANFTVGQTQYRNFNELGRVGSGDVSLTTEWQEFGFNFVTPANADTVRVPLHFSFDANIGNTIYIDSVTVTHIPSQDDDDPVDMTPIADGQDKWIGNIWSPPQIENFTSYWNQVTAENAGKWGSVEGTRGTYNWSNLDASYQLARDNGFPYRFHVLTWGGQQPGWINDLSTEEQLEAITQWYDTLAVRYPDMEYVEVVNEGSNNHQLPDGQSGDANYIEALGGTGETGHDWIITAFEMARERFPNSKLMINDYNIVSSETWGTRNARNYKQIIDDLVERDLIDVIGVQAHAFSTPGSQAQIRRVLDLLAETGLPIQATEMDIQGNSDLSQEASDQLQLENMQRIFPVFWEHPAVEGITFWGWRPGLWMDDAELIYPNGEERPALTWLREYVENWVEPEPTDVSGDATPVRFELSQNYPNPFNPTTQIRYEVAEQADVSLQVYDITGRLVQTLVNNTAQAPGQYSVTFDGSNLASGVYLYRLQAGSFSDVRRMMLVK
ncbi:endo-1,4-beta-xylanase [Balneolales bacterium ANBcel1]|nr:endo-1,4-beta-xylanase [Balneolales bacterium ANBcel1]